MFTVEPVNTETSVVTDLIETGATVLTGERCAVISVDDTVTTLVALGTLTVVGTVGVTTGSTVPARSRDLTLVHVLVTQSPCVADSAGTGEVHEVGGRGTLGAVVTSVGCTRV